MSNGYQDIWYRSDDGLKLYAREYSAKSDSRMAVLCLHGLSRNSADFEDLAPHLSERARVISVDQRGRGLSQWDSDPSHYNPAVYVQDMWRLLDSLDIERVVLVGTSMGGIMSMMMAAEKPQRVAAVILNDICPDVAPEGLARIMSYVGKGKVIRTWEDAIARTRELNQMCFPDYDEHQWQVMAKRLYREDQNGVPVLAYDPAISKPIDRDSANAAPPDLWPLFDCLEGIPVLAIRGALSDILAPEGFEKMARVLPHIIRVEVPGVGHAPALDEAEALVAIDGFLNSL